MRRTDKTKKEEKAPTAGEINAKIQGYAEATRLSLEREQKVMFLIPLERGEAKGSTHPVIINGYRMNVPKGKMAPVPMSVAKLLAVRYDVSIGSEKRLDTAPQATRDALNA